MDVIEIIRQKVLGALAVVLDERLLGRTLQTSKPPKYEAYLEYVEGCDLHVKSDWAGAVKHYARAFTEDTTFLEPLLGMISGCENLGRNEQADSVATFLESHRSRLTALQRQRLDGDRAYLAGDLQRSLEAMRQAAQIAPGSAYAYQWGIHAYWVNRPRECICALMTMDPKRGWARGWMHYWAILTMSYHILGEHEEELRLARQSREIYPDRIEPLCFEARALIGMGRVHEATRLLEQCAAQDKDPSTWMGYVVKELRRHGYENAAMEWSNRAVRWYESKPAGGLKALRAEYADALYAARSWQEAKAIYEELAEESPENIDYEACLGCIAARLGDRETATATLQRLKEMNRPFLLGHDTYWGACIAAILGDKDMAVALLRDSFARGVPLKNHVWADFDLESIWDYPQYTELMTPKG
jgi:tetratricopeptide (TPR) repeat protein